MAKKQKSFLPNKVQNQEEPGEDKKKERKQKEVC